MDYKHSANELENSDTTSIQPQGTEHLDPEVAAWSISFEKVKQANPRAAELLCCCAFLAPTPTESNCQAFLFM